MSDSLSQTPFTEVELIENPSRRCPVVLLLDTSYSMGGKPIEQLNKAVEHFLNEVQKDSLASKRVELSILKFDSKVTPVVNFSSPDSIDFEPLETNGVTSLGAGLNVAMKHLEARKDQYKNNGIDYYRPWLLLITDGAPTDNWQSVAQKLKTAESNGKFSMFSIGVEGADFDVLNSLSDKRPAMKLKGLKFVELFDWLSKSVTAISNSRPGEQVSLPNPGGWADIEV